MRGQGAGRAKEESTYFLLLGLWVAVFENAAS